MSTPRTGFAKRLNSIRQGLLKPVDAPHWAIDQAEGVVIHGHASKYIVRTPAGRAHYLELMDHVQREDLQLMPAIRRVPGLRMVAPELSIPVRTTVLATQQEAALNFHAYRAGLRGWRLRIDELYSDGFKLIAEPVTHPDDPAVLLDSRLSGDPTVMGKNSGGRTVQLRDCLTGLAHPGSGATVFWNALEEVLETYRVDDDASALHSLPAPVPVVSDAPESPTPDDSKKRWYSRG